MPPSQMRSERVLDQLEKPLVAAAQPGPPDQFIQRGIGEFRRAAQAAVGRGRTRRRSARRAGRARAAPIATLPAGRAWLASRSISASRFWPIFVGLLAKQPRHLAQHVDEGRPAVARRFRKIGAAPDRLALRRQEHRQRPAALLAQMMQRRHVDLVDVGAFLAVDFDVDEQLVHHRRGGFVLEALVRHDVAPVAGGIADRQQDRLAGGLCLGQRVRTPGPPGHRDCACAATDTGWSRGPADFRARSDGW